MLGRAKWDAWKKLEGLQPVDAKKLYIETLLKVCRFVLIFTSHEAPSITLKCDVKF